jgi:hypothetical protein
MAGTVLGPQPGWGRDTRVEVRSLGLSKVGENTMLTVVLDRLAAPLVSTRTVSGQPQLVVDFPRARAAGPLPRRLGGDESLVKQVLTETAASGGGVRIILDLFPEKPYVYWKQSRTGKAGQALFFLGLKPESPRPPAQAVIVPPEEPAPAAEAAPMEETQEKATVPEAPAPGEEGGYHELQAPVVPGSFADLRRLMPRATRLLQGLETDGWVVTESNRYDHPGQRFSRDFILTNQKYPELVVEIVYLPANLPDTPNIDILMLSTKKLNSEAASQYRSLRRWSFARIKKQYEDIGDFFDDALKPLRVKLRHQTQALALKDAAVFQNFLNLACPNDPQIASKVMEHVRGKVNPRFEGVEFTISEKPLVFLNLVDFLYVKVYFVGNH